MCARASTRVEASLLSAYPALLTARPDSNDPNIRATDGTPRLKGSAGQRPSQTIRDSKIPILVPMVQVRILAAEQQASLLRRSTAAGPHPPMTSVGPEQAIHPVGELALGVVQDVRLDIHDDADRAVANAAP